MPRDAFEISDDEWSRGAKGFSNFSKALGRILSKAYNWVFYPNKKVQPPQPQVKAYTATEVNKMWFDGYVAGRKWDEKKKKLITNLDSVPELAQRSNSHDLNQR